MSIIWGKYRSGCRVGVEVAAIPAITSATATIALAVDVWLDTGTDTTNDHANTLTWSGGVVTDGHADDLALTGKGVRKIRTLAGQAHAISYGATTTATITVLLENLGNADGDITVTTTVTYPARPWDVPAAPTGCAVARMIDYEHVVSWANHPTATAPVTTNTVLRSTDGAAFVGVASFPGSVSSYADRTTAADHSYAYKVTASNSAGSATSGQSATVYTTPAAPSNVVAVRSGDTMTLTWKNNARFADNVLIMAAQESAPGSSSYAWTSPAATLGAGAVSWIQEIDGALGHIYKVQAVKGALVSTLSPAAFLPPNMPPAAPTVTVPSAADAVNAITVKLTHNPVDTTALTSAHLRYRYLGETDWAGLVTMGWGTTSYTFAAGHFDNGNVLEVQAQTRGEAPDYGQWSASQVILLVASPVVTMIWPEDNSVIDAPTAGLEWSVFDASGAVQTGIEVYVHNMDTGEWDYHRQLLGYWAQTFSLPQLIFTNGETAEVAMRVQTGNGLWSNIVTQHVTVDFAEPPTPTIAAEWVEDTGSTSFAVTVPGASEGEVDAHGVHVQRLAADGTWVDIADLLVPDGGGAIGWIDRIPPLSDVLTYRAYSYSDIGTTATSAEVSVDPSVSRDYVYLNAGPDWGVRARLRSNLNLSKTGGRAKTLFKAAGRTKPLEVIGEQRSKSFSITGDVASDDRLADRMGGWAQFDDIADMPAPICFRDPFGHRMFVSISEDVGQTFGNPTTGISYQVTEIDHDE